MVAEVAYSERLGDTTIYGEQNSRAIADPGINIYFMYPRDFKSSLTPGETSIVCRSTAW